MLTTIFHDVSIFALDLGSIKSWVLVYQDSTFSDTATTSSTIYPYTHTVQQPWALSPDTPTVIKST